MLTLSDINALTDSHDGDIYSDLYKDVYGMRPRGSTFASLDEFQEDFDQLSEQLSRQIDQEALDQAAWFEEFKVRVADTMQMVVNCTSREAAVKIIADAEGIRADEIEFYGWEVLEYRLCLRFNSIKNWLKEEA